jgi:hypothetical protein
VQKTIAKLREQVRDQKYLISVHANEEMSNDELMAIDVENAILTGKIVKRLPRIPEGRDMKSLVKHVTASPSRLSVGPWELVGLQ